MEYLAHIDGDRAQSIKDHLQGTADLAEEFAAKFGKADWGYCCGMLHDMENIPRNFKRRSREIWTFAWTIPLPEQRSAKNWMVTIGS